MRRGKTTKNNSTKRVEYEMFLVDQWEQRNRASVRAMGSLFALPPGCRSEVEQRGTVHRPHNRNERGGEYMHELRCGAAGSRRGVR